VGITGFGNFIPGIDIGESHALHDALPPPSERVHASIKLTHLAAINPARLKGIIDEHFKCGSSDEVEDRDLIVLAHSWGSGAANKLAELFQSACNREAAAVYILDGIQPPTMTPFKKRPPARMCMNIYHTLEEGKNDLDRLHGDSIDGCKNFNFTDICRERFPLFGGEAISGTGCHVVLEGEGAAISVEDMKYNFLGYSP
jgi:hypothetical protein